MNKTILKSTSVVLLLVVGLMVASCDWFRFGDKVPDVTCESISYSLTFSVEHIGQMDEDSCKVYNVVSDDQYPKVSNIPVKIEKTETGEQLLTFSLLGGMEDVYRKTTFQMTCPYIFHDKDVHEIVAQWVIPSESTRIQGDALLYDMHFARCAILSIDGKDAKLIEYDSYPNSKQVEMTNFVTID